MRSKYSALSDTLRGLEHHDSKEAAAEMEKLILNAVKK